MPAASYTTDGAELGKMMVAEGLGITVLPDFSVAGDPLERAGLITHRPLAEDATAVTLVLLQRRQQHVPRPVRDLEAALVARARTHRRAGTLLPGTERREATSEPA
jgi:DNA-binding transcriptional LysR family regulator